MLEEFLVSVLKEECQQDEAPSHFSHYNSGGTSLVKSFHGNGLAEAALYFGHLLILSVRRLISSFGVLRGGGWDV
jgi:hypothetical protein